MASMIHAMNHHAKDKTEVINAVSLMYATELSPKGWRTMNVRGGTNSWLLHHTQTGKQLHLRNGGKGIIKVYEHYNYRSKNLAPVAVLSSRVGVYRWAKNLKP